MTILLATVGYTPEKVTHALTRESDVRSITLFYGSSGNRATARAVRAIRQACSPLDLPVKDVELGTAYDFTAAVLAYRREIRAHRDRPLLFNLSGGTGVMQAAASFVCFTEGIPSVYYNREEKTYVRMPTLRLSPGEPLTPQQRRIVDLLLAAPHGLRAADIARRLRMSPSNLDYHLKRLREKDVVANDERPGIPGRPILLTSLGRTLYHE